MSRIGRKVLEIPKGISVQQSGHLLSVDGPKGKEQIYINGKLKIDIKDGLLEVVPEDKSIKTRSLWGLTRAQIGNAINGVANHFTKSLKLTGVGFRANMKGKQLELQLGFSHKILYDIPEGIEIKIDKQTTIIVSGHNKQAVGQFAAEIRSLRKPEPYKGKGVAYSDEYIVRKEGKKK